MDRPYLLIMQKFSLNLSNQTALENGWQIHHGDTKVFLHSTDVYKSMKTAWQVAGLCCAWGLDRAAVCSQQARGESLHVLSSKGC